MTQVLEKQNKISDRLTALAERMKKSKARPFPASILKVREKMVNGELKLIGDSVPQGDLRVQRMPSGWIQENMKNLQQIDLTPTEHKLVLDSNTSGAEHKLENANYTAYVLKNAKLVDGPYVLFHGPNNLKHPEHGHIVGFQAGDEFRFPSQRVWQDEERKARD